MSETVQSKMNKISTRDEGREESTAPLSQICSSFRFRKEEGRKERWREES